MKLYICLTTYHMLAACAVALKDKENSAELLVESFVDEESDIVKAIKDSGIFKEVYFVNQTDAWKEINKLDMESTSMQILAAAKSAVLFWSNNFKYFQQINKRYSDINIWDDHFTLGVALAYRKIPYNYFEESPGCHCRREVFVQLSIDKITNKAFAPISEQFGLRGNYPYAKSYNFDLTLNSVEKGKKDRDFSLVKELKQLKSARSDEFELLKKIFAPDGFFLNYSEAKHDKKQKHFLLIGQHYSVSTYRNTNMIRYVLSLLVDYFGENMNLWIKNHPSNYFNPMQQWFLDANMIVDKIPLELLIADDVLHFDRVASISSSAPLIIQDSNTDVILFQNKEDGDSFESQRRFLDLHRYFVITKLVEKMCKEKLVNSFYTCGVEMLSLQDLIKYQSMNVPTPETVTDISDMLDLEKDANGIRCFFIDRLQIFCESEKQLRKKVSEWLLSCDENDVVFFANSDGRNVFCDADNVETTEFLYPLPFDVIDSSGCSGLFGYGNSEYPLNNTIGKLHQESYRSSCNTERQIVYMYTKNEEVVRMLLSYHVEKKMQHCGIELIYNPTSINYKEIIFESMLEQLEEQYMVLQEENVQLRMQMAEEVRNNELQNAVDIHQKVVDKALVDAINTSSAMLMNRMTEIDERLIKFLSWYGFKKRIKEKIQCIFRTKQ